ncbi:uncharacterized protein MAM_04806 [Metarhizium album ARSEF 1941]|uniref:Nuclear condensin complex subunit Smc4 n=1 Tax=Metarhizium album (strain ARSEF 1941) TaxID=1081103 RepID=A0A0B2WU90_METAS|nr:uncharacterized protein MAM_04806 [Metarhizium album ARSEF 1941]KHN97209.1 hypothetical protein MAM_04806 [Metarhizium album ARSEF 1941]
MLVIFSLSLLHTVSASSSSSNVVLVCTKDALYSSLYQNGRQFCSSVLGKPPCEVVTPTAYATYDPAVVSSRCGPDKPDVFGYRIIGLELDYGGLGLDDALRLLVRVDLVRVYQQFLEQPALEHSGLVVADGSGLKHSVWHDVFPAKHPTLLAKRFRSTTFEQLVYWRFCEFDGNPKKPWAVFVVSAELRGRDLERGLDVAVFDVNVTTVGLTIPGPGSSSSSPNSTSSIHDTAPAAPSTHHLTSGSTGSETSSWPASTATATTTHAESAPSISTSIYVSASPSTTTPLASLSVANLTQVTRTAAVAEETCYRFPQDPDAEDKRRSVFLHNRDVEAHNDTLPSPYMESVFFDADGVHPVFLTLLDPRGDRYYMDVSNRSHLSVMDSERNSILIDASGVHFSTETCAYDVSITIKDMYEQLESLSGELCSKLIPDERLTEDSSFEQVLFLRDQCGNAIQRSVRKYPALRVGESDCVDTEVDSSTGKWTFLCTFPGSDSATSRCRASVNKDIVRFLLTDPFGGACPDLSTVATTLAATAQDLLGETSLKEELYKLSLDAAQRREADSAVEKYAQLWSVFKQALSRDGERRPRRGSALEQYIRVYNKYRSFEGDICGDLHDDDLPLNMSLRAGVTAIDSITSLKAVPGKASPFNVTVQDATQVACCQNGGNSSFGRLKGSCSYPANATVGNSDCICGQTSAGDSVAFEYMECADFVGRCTSDHDCADAGYKTYKCLTGSCCGSGVCFDPHACSQRGVKLV